MGGLEVAQLFVSCVKSLHWSQVPPGGKTCAQKEASLHPGSRTNQHCLCMVQPHLPEHFLSGDELLGLRAPGIAPCLLPS